MRDPDTRTDRAVRTILISLLDTIEEEEAEVRSNGSEEGIHQYRVAVRRTRSVAGEMEGAFPVGSLTPFLSEFKSIATLTGPIRDIDVFLIRMKEYEAQADTDTLSAVSLITEREYEERLDHMVALRGALDADRYVQLLSEWRAMLTQSDLADSETRYGNEPILDSAARQIGRAFRRVRARANLLLASNDFGVEVVHRLRISCKKLRYLLEAFADVLGPEPVAELVAVQKRLQDATGEFHDLGLQRRRLESIQIECSDAASLDSPIVESFERFDAWLIARLETTESELKSALQEFLSPESYKRFGLVLGQSVEVDEPSFTESGRDL